MRRFIVLIIAALPLMLYGQRNLPSHQQGSSASWSTIQLLDAAQPTATLLQINLNLKELSIETNLTHYGHAVSDALLRSRFHQFYESAPLWESGLSQSLWFQHPVSPPIPTLELRIKD